MYKKLFIPGPVPVHEDIMAAMAKPLIGHRMPEYAQLHERVTNGLKKVMFTNQRVFLATSSAFGVMEGAIRNLVGTRCANFCNGAFSDKWGEMSQRLGLDTTILKAEWGKPILADDVKKALIEALTEFKRTFKK